MNTEGSHNDDLDMNQVARMPKDKGDGGKMKQSSLQRIPTRISKLSGLFPTPSFPSSLRKTYVPYPCWYCPRCQAQYCSVNVGRFDLTMNDTVCIMASAFFSIKKLHVKKNQNILQLAQEILPFLFVSAYLYFCSSKNFLFPI